MHVARRRSAAPIAINPQAAHTSVRDSASPRRVTPSNVDENSFKRAQCVVEGIHIGALALESDTTSYLDADAGATTKG